VGSPPWSGSAPRPERPTKSSSSTPAAFPAARTCISAVFWKSFSVPGIPGAAGSVRWRKVKTKNGPAFRQYFVFFSLGPNGYGETVGGPYGTVSQQQFVRGVTALYHRLQLG